MHRNPLKLWIGLSVTSIRNNLNNNIKTFRSLFRSIGCNWFRLNKVFLFPKLNVSYKQTHFSGMDLYIQQLHFDSAERNKAKTNLLSVARGGEIEWNVIFGNPKQKYFISLSLLLAYAALEVRFYFMSSHRRHSLPQIVENDSIAHVKIFE